MVPDLLRGDRLAWVLLAVGCSIDFLAANAMRRFSSRAAAFYCMLATAHLPVPWVMSHDLPWFPGLFFVLDLIAWRGIVLANRFLQANPLPKAQQEAPLASGTAPPQLSGNVSGVPTLHAADVLPLSPRTGIGRAFLDTFPPLLWPRLQWLYWPLVVLLTLFQVGLIALRLYANSTTQ